MPVDITRLNGWLNISKVQTSNNPLWQILNTIIAFIKENSDEIIALHNVVPTDSADPNTVLHGANDPRFRQVATEDIYDANVTYIKIQDVVAEKLLGRGQGSGDGTVEEITLGTNLSMTGTTLNATASAATTDYTNSFLLMGA